MSIPQISRGLMFSAIILSASSATASPELGCHLVGASADYTVACSNTADITGIGVTAARQIADEQYALFRGGSQFSLGQSQGELSSYSFDSSRREWGITLDAVSLALQFDSGAPIDGAVLNQMSDDSSSNSQPRRFSQVSTNSPGLIVQQAYGARDFDALDTVANPNGVKDYSRLPGSNTSMSISAPAGSYGSLIRSNPDKLIVDRIIKGSPPNFSVIHFGEITANVETTTIGNGGGLPGLSSDDQSSPFVFAQIPEPKSLLLLLVGLLLMIKARSLQASSAKQRSTKL